MRRTSSGDAWVLVHPRCARDRAEDIAEVRSMIAADELEISRDELRWLLSGCSQFIEAHTLLGELALAMDRDYPLARGHFGTAFQLGIRALERAGMPCPVPYSQPANRPLLDAARGLVQCLTQLSKPNLAKEIVETILKLDPTDPLSLSSGCEDGSPSTN